MKIIFDNLQDSMAPDVFFHWASYENAALPALYIFHRSDNSKNAIFLFENVYRSAYGPAFINPGLLSSNAHNSAGIKPYVLYETTESKWLEPGKINAYPTSGDTNELLYDPEKMKHFIYRAGDNVFHLLAEKYTVNPNPAAADFYYEI